MNESWMSHGMFMAALSLSALAVFFGAGRVAGVGGAGPLYDLVTLLFGLAWAAGLLLLDPNQRLGLWLLALGWLGVCTLLFWMFFLTLPAAAATVAMVYFRVRQPGSPHGTGAA